MTQRVMPELMGMKNILVINDEGTSLLPRKARHRNRREARVRKHGVAFEEALTVFADPLARIFDYPDHSSEERRELIIGHSAKGRVLIVSFTGQGPRTRIISARKATKRERHNYEENTKED